jgi:hypothetical protein
VRALDAGSRAPLKGGLFPATIASPNLMQKLGLHNTAEIVLSAVRKAIIPVS